ncbi:unnamed protein product [Paramecium primaurelia]|uniref:Polyadenylate-binding protein n=1 Tax=Paramecium primaurelia TaxID=5886 RepID=A0A8S1MPF9_PARPR|nr:unnamed protein product [Paramecium primaurelia]
MLNIKEDIGINKKPEQQKNIIYIENLDKVITEDFLFHQFKQFGDISIIKLKRDKYNNISSGQALITFSDAESAEKARQTLDNQKLINNIIKVKPYVNLNEAEKNANIYMKNLPKNVKVEELEQEFQKYGNILSIDVRKDSKGNCLNYGYIQFQKKDDAQLFLEQMQKNSFNYQGNEIHFELFKSSQERIKELNELFLRGFSHPLPDNAIQDDKIITAIEFGWQMVIKDYFIKQQDHQIQDCFVKIDKNTRQPWTIIKFEFSDQAKFHFNICENQRSHPCVQSNIFYVIELIQKCDIAQSNFSDMKLTIQEIVSIYQSLANNKFDIFSGISDNFFFNLKQNQQQSIDERQLYFQNINNYVNEYDIQSFLQQFGNVISVTMKQSTKPYQQLQDCIVLYQTFNDAKCALSQIYDRKYSQNVNHIFKYGIIKISIYLGKNLRQEFKQVKKQRQRLVYNSMIKQEPNILLFQPQQPLIQKQYNNKQPINNTQMLISKYSTIEIIKAQMDNFLGLSDSDQRNILGALLFYQVVKVVKNQNITRQIVGMLIEPSQFPIQDIIELFDNDADLQEYIQEGLELIKDNQKRNN